MPECTSGNLTVLVMDADETDSLSQLFLDHLNEVHDDPILESVGLALGVI